MGTPLLLRLYTMGNILEYDSGKVKKNIFFLNINPILSRHRLRIRLSLLHDAFSADNAPKLCATDAEKRLRLR